MNLQYLNSENFEKVIEPQKILFVSPSITVTESDIEDLFFNCFELYESEWAEIIEDDNWTERKNKGIPYYIWASKLIIEGKKIYIKSNKTTRFSSSVDLNDIIEAKKHYTEYDHILQKAAWGDIIY